MLALLAAPTVVHADDLVTVDVATGHVTKLTANVGDGELCWGPRGIEARTARRIGRGRWEHVVAAYAPGQRPRVLIPDDPGKDITAIWRPTGCNGLAESHYAFADTRSHVGGVLVRDPAGREAARALSAEWPVNEGVSWSADGQRVAIGLNERRGFAVRVYEVASGRLLLRRTGEDGELGLPAQPFSPDGGRIALSEDGGVVVVDLATRHARTIAGGPDGRELIEAAWSPRADVVAARNAGGGIELLDPATGHGPALAARAAGEPVWSPDGLSLAYANGGGLSVVAASAGAAPRHLVVAAKTEWTAPVWSPDGRHLAAARQQRPY